MGPYEPTGTFTSRVLGAGSAGAHWQTLDAALDAPDGTAVTLETRSGATAAPDAGWSAWSAVGAGGAVTSPAGRYVQYRATLTGGTDLLTPTIESVTLSATADRPPGGGGTAPPRPPAGGGPAPPADSGTTIRQTPTAGAPAGTTAPSAPAPAAPKPTGGDVAGATATSPAVRGLTATRSVALRMLARRGLVLRLVAPSGTGSLDVRLYRVATKRVTGRTVTRRTRVLRGAIAVRHGGRL